MGKKADAPFLEHEKRSDSHRVAAQLRVLVTPSIDGGFVAQGLEVDYLATGATLDEVQQNFANGFLATVEAILRRGRDLTSLFKSSAPLEAWQQYIAGNRKHTLTCETILDIQDRLPQGAPFASLAFCQPAAA